MFVMLRGIFHRAFLPLLLGSGVALAEPTQPQPPVGKPPAQESYRPSPAELAALVACEKVVLGEASTDIRSKIYDIRYGQWLILGKGAEEIIRCLVGSHGWTALTAQDGRRGARASRFQGGNAEAAQPAQPVAKTPGQEDPERVVAAARIWERARYDLTIQTAKQALERGETAEAERLCFLAITYVGARTVRVLEEYAALLATLNRAGAQNAKERAGTLNDQRLKREPGSIYLGFEPADELMAYARLLRELARTAEADTVVALADAERKVARTNFIRNVILQKGGDPRGTCSE